MSVLFDDGAVSTSGYEITNSLMFRGSQYLSRTPVVAGNRKVWTYAFKFRRGTFVIGPFLTVGAGYPGGAIGLDTGDVLSFWEYTGSGFNLKLVTTQVFRDPSAWYDVVIAFDSTQAVSTDRVKIWVNGVRVTAFTTATYPAQNYDSYFNNANIHKIGTGMGAGNLDGYVAEPIFVDGLALDPSYFGKFDTVTGQWVAKKYTGTFGTNGFCLGKPFNGASLGTDYSGNGNNWTANNFSASDVVLDSPSNVYATLNAVFAGQGSSLSSGNLTLTCSSNFSAYGSMSPTSGKWYFEAVMNGGTPATGTWVGLRNPYDGGSVEPIYRMDGVTNLPGTPTFSTYTSGDVIGVAFDVTNATVRFYKNGVLQGSGDYSFTLPAGSGLTSECRSTTGSWSFNFGQKTFAYAAPDGYKTLCTKNLPEPSIKKGSSGFNAVTWTGNGTTKSITGVGHQPDLVWLKRRDAAAGHILQDSVRGTYRYLNVNSTDPENTNPLYDWFQSFDGDGFTVKYQSSSGTNTNEFDLNGATYVGWSWKKGAAYGLDILANVVGGSVNVAHALGVTPQMVIFKKTNVVSDWSVWHTSITNPNNNYLLLNTTGSVNASTGWCSPTSTNIAANIGSASDRLSVLVFSGVEGFSKFGSYTGNGSADGPFVFTGFKPRWIMVKRTDAAGDWQIIDTNRDAFNASTNDLLWSNLSNTSSVSYKVLDAMSNGFKLKDATTPWNASGGTYIYACFAECPYKYSNAR